MAGNPVDKLFWTWLVGALFLLFTNIPSCTARIQRLPAPLPGQNAIVRTDKTISVVCEYIARGVVWPLVVGWTGMHAVMGDVDWGWDKSSTKDTPKAQGDGDACR